MRERLGAGRTPHTLGLAAVLLSVLSFSVSLSVIKWPGIPGSVIAWWRLVGSSILWWLFVGARHRRTGRPMPGRGRQQPGIPAGHRPCNG